MILGLLALGLLAGVALTVHPAQAVDAVGPYYALPSWDRKMAPVDRFVVLTNWNSAAVLDKETGLVWERSPESSLQAWSSARSGCLNRTTGARKGWRLATVDELQSLIDPAVAPPGPVLPPGHPFSNVQSTYWSASTKADLPDFAFVVFFDQGFVSWGPKSSSGPVWCVRGGNNALAY